MIEPRLGLLPLGRDPGSGLWEFAHLATCADHAPPVRDAQGELVVTEGTGIVLVLIPGGTFWLGEQTEDPDAPNYFHSARAIDGPAKEVTLSPYYLSKYEMTQGQWLRLAGRNPSTRRGTLPADDDRAELDGRPRDLRHPVETVTWDECVLWLGRAGLTLPSEAQWERAARGGTTTLWWTGSERAGCYAAENIRDRSYALWAERHFSIEHGGEVLEHDDGWAGHAPVGSFAPNPFGLHDVHGNVVEWCLDAYDANYHENAADRDPLLALDRARYRPLRGGFLGSGPGVSRAGFRNRTSPQDAKDGIGVRPAATLAP